MAAAQAAAVAYGQALSTWAAAAAQASRGCHSDTRFELALGAGAPVSPLPNPNYATAAQS